MVVFGKMVGDINWRFYIIRGWKSYQRQASKKGGVHSRNTKNIKFVLLDKCAGGEYLQVTTTIGRGKGRG